MQRSQDALDNSQERDEPCGISFAVSSPDKPIPIDNARHVCPPRRPAVGKTPTRHDQAYAHRARHTSRQHHPTAGDMATNANSTSKLAKIRKIHTRRRRNASFRLKANTYHTSHCRYPRDADVRVDLSGRLQHDKEERRRASARSRKRYCVFWIRRGDFQIIILSTRCSCAISFLGVGVIFRELRQRQAEAT
jgi:hypothetical protein